MSLIYFTYILTVSAEYVEQKLDSTMTLGWDIDKIAQQITFTLKCQIASGYCAFGLGNSMFNSDMYVFLAFGTNIEVKDCWSTGHVTPSDDTKVGGQYSLTNVSFQISKSSIQAQFTRKLNTGDQYDAVIIPDVSTSVIWAYLDGASDVIYHGPSRCKIYIDFGQVKFATNSSSGTGNSGGTSSSDFPSNTENHGRIMTIVWLGLASIGIIAARFFKAYRFWFPVHFLTLLICSVLTIISSAAQYREDKLPYSYATTDMLVHSRLGNILSALVIGQVVFGMLGNMFKLFTKKSQLAVMLLKAHKATGYAMFAIGLANLNIGWKVYGEDNPRYGVTILYLAIIGLALIFNIFLNIQRRKIRLPDRKLPETTHLEAIEQVKNGKKWMFADELVIDVSSFARSHPGGRFLISEAISEDAGKYMVGCSSYGSNFNAYSHSTKAFGMLRTLAVGRISPPEGYLKPYSEVKSPYMSFSVKLKKNLNSHTRILYLSSNEYEISSTCQHPFWLGKHFMFVCPNKPRKNIQRYYSALFAEIIEWQNYDLMIENINNTTNCLKFIFKVYPDGKMTTFLDKLKEGDFLTIRGPLGPGLLLNDLEGSYLALAGGTGLVPFIDLVDMVHKRTEKRTQFKLILYVFFRTFKDGFALEWLQEIAKSNSWFDLVIVTDEYRGKEKIPMELKEKIRDGIDLAWICGPSGFNRSYHELLMIAGVKRDQIVLL